MQNIQGLFSAFRTIVAQQRLAILCVCQCSTTPREKKKKIATLIKKLNNENVKLFGPLRESRNERRKTVMQQKEFIPVPKENSSLSNERRFDSAELNWHLNLTNTKRIGNYNGVTQMTTTRALNKSKAEPDASLKSDSHCVAVKVSSDVHIIGKSSHLKVSQTVLKNDLEPIDDKSADLNTIELAIQNSNAVRNVVNFPLINVSKCSDESPGILSISRDDYKTEGCKEYLKYPSVSQILKATSTPESIRLLSFWKARMIKQLGEEGFKKMVKDQIQTGYYLHEILRYYLKGTEERHLNIVPEVQGLWRSITHILKNVTNVKVVESQVVHPELQYRGVIDCVAQYGNELMLMEWKTSQKLKSSIDKTYEAPLQLTAYLGALGYDPKYSLQIKSGLVVVAYADGSDATAFYLREQDLESYWSKWLERLSQFNKIKHDENVLETSKIEEDTASLDL